MPRALPSTILSTLVIGVGVVRLPYVDPHQVVRIKDGAVWTIALAVSTRESKRTRPTLLDYGKLLCYSSIEITIRILHKKDMPKLQES